MSDLPEAVGTVLGPSAWHTVDQDRVDAFADATDDHQWIHVDADRAEQTPFGGTVAHGYLTLSLAPALLEEVLAIDDGGMTLNYGANKVRFPAPLRVGSRVRMIAEIASVEPAKDGGTQVEFVLTFEAEGAEKPCCVAAIVFRYYPQSAESETAEGASRTPAAPTWTALPGPDAAELAAAWLRWLGGSYGVWASSLERTRQAAVGDPKALVPPLAQHAELASRYWADVFSTTRRPTR